MHSTSAIHPPRSACANGRTRHQLRSVPNLFCLRYIVRNATHTQPITRHEQSMEPPWCGIQQATRSARVCFEEQPVTFISQERGALYSSCVRHWQHCSVDAVAVKMPQSEFAQRISRERILHIGSMSRYEQGPTNYTSHSEQADHLAQ